MRYELQKVLRSYSGVAILILAIIVNGMLFYGHCIEKSDGFTLLQVKEKYNNLDSLAEELEDINIQIESLLLSNNLSSGNNLVTDNIFTERKLDLEVLERVNQVLGYQEYLAGIKQQAMLWMNSAFNGPKDNFSVRSLHRSIEIYTALEKISPKITFSGGIEAISSWRTSDLFLLLFCLLPSLQLITQEHTAGYKLLLLPTANGRSRLYLRKFGALVVIALTGCVLLYGTNVVIAEKLLGFGDISAPVQSIHGFRACPFALTIGEFLLSFLLFKLVLLISMASLAFLLCSLSRDGMYALLYSALIIGMSLIMNSSSNLWLRSLNFIGISDFIEIINGNFFLNFVGIPVWRIAFIVLFCVACIFVCYIGGMVAFFHIPSYPRLRGTVRIGIVRQQHVNLLCHEAHKFLFMNHALLVLALFVIIQTATYHNYYIQSDSKEYYYRQYSELLSGPPSEGKYTFLQKEKEHFKELKEEINLYTSSFNLSSADAFLATKHLTEQLEREQGFEQAISQYESLQGGMSYVYQSGYTRLYGTHGQVETLWNLVKLLLTLIITCSGFFAQEYEVGMLYLLRASCKASTIVGRKLLIVLCFLFPTMLVAFLPQYIIIYCTYGMPQMSATANSLYVFQYAPPNLKICHIIFLTTIILTSIAVIACLLIVFLSCKTKSTILTLIISGAILLFPTLLAIMFLAL